MIVLINGTRPKQTKETNVVMAEILLPYVSSILFLLWYERSRDDVSHLFLEIRFVMVSNSVWEYPG